MKVDMPLNKEIKPIALLIFIFHLFLSQHFWPTPSIYQDYFLKKCIILKMSLQGHKSKVWKEKYFFFSPFSFGISNWGIILSLPEHEKLPKMSCYIVTQLLIFHVFKLNKSILYTTAMFSFFFSYLIFFYHHDAQKSSLFLFCDKW